MLEPWFLGHLGYLHHIFRNSTSARICGALHIGSERSRRAQAVGAGLGRLARDRQGVQPARPSSHLPRRPPTVGTDLRNRAPCDSAGNAPSVRRLTPGLPLAWTVHRFGTGATFRSPHDTQWIRPQTTCRLRIGNLPLPPSHQKNTSWFQDAAVDSSTIPLKSARKS